MTALRAQLVSLLYWISHPVLKRRGPASSVYFTFDDGPHESRTLMTLRLLRETGASATFFFNGNLMEKYPEIVRQVVDQGHEVGYHSFEHNYPSSINPFRCIRDLERGEELLNRFGVRSRLYRPPYGKLTILMLICTALRGWTTVLWNVESRDSFDDGEEVLARLTGLRENDGSIVLMHEVYEDTVRILPRLLEHCQRSGLQLATLKFD